MSRKRTLIWTGLAVTLLVFGVFVWLALTEWFGVIYLPGGTQTVGNFTIKSYRTEGFGHTGSKQTLYFRGRKLGGNLDAFVASPLDPDRALYRRYCEDGKPREECGLFYFDGRRQRSFQIEPYCHEWPCYNVSLNALGPEYTDQYHHPWSVDGRFVMIQDQYKLLLVDLETGEHSDFAQRLDAQAVQQPMPPTRYVYFAGWSPDMRQAAVLLSTEADPHPPVTHFVTDLYTVELPARQLTYRCSIGPYADAEVEHGWEQSGAEFKFQFRFPHARTSVRIYDKNTNGACSY